MNSVTYIILGISLILTAVLLFFLKKQQDTIETYKRNFKKILQEKDEEIDRLQKKSS